MSQNLENRSNFEIKKIKDSIDKGDTISSFAIQSSLKNSDKNTDFYSNNRGNDAEDNEAKRLSTMAKMADSISGGLILEGSLPGDTVVDVGSGDSTSLGKILLKSNLNYIPIDQRQGAVEKQRDAGFDSVQSSASDIRLPSDIANVVHSRFTMSWLDSNQRFDAYCEMARLTKDGGKIIIIDYNWSDIDGPEILVNAAKLAMGLLKNIGFDPDFGSKISDDFSMSKINIEKASGKNLKLAGEYISPIYEGTIDDCLPIFEQTATSILDYLSEIGDYESYEKLSNCLDELKRFSLDNQDEKVRLANVFGCTICVDKNSDVLLNDKVASDSLESKSNEPLVMGVDYVGIAEIDNDILKNTVRLTSERAISYARKLQGASYVHHGLVSKDAISNDGTLSTKIDPEEQIKRSEYIATLDDSGNILTCIRLIKTDSNNDITKLPTINRLGIDIFKQYGIESSKSDEVIEVSALSSDIKYGSFEDVIKTVIGLMIYAKKCKYKSAVMELRNDKVKIFQTLLGKDNLIMVDESLNDSHTIDIDGVSQSTKYSCMIGHPNEFCEQVGDYIKTRIAEANLRGKKISHLLQMISDALINA